MFGILNDPISLFHSSNEPDLTDYRLTMGDFVGPVILSEMAAIKQCELLFDQATKRHVCRWEDPDFGPESDALADKTFDRKLEWAWLEDLSKNPERVSEGVKFVDGPLEA